MTILRVWGVWIELNWIDTVLKLFFSNVNNTPTRFFRAWLEDWEIEIVKDNDDPVKINEAKFLKKYGGLVWYDHIDEK